MREGIYWYNSLVTCEGAIWWYFLLRFEVLTFPKLGKHKKKPWRTETRWTFCYWLVRYSKPQYGVQASDSWDDMLALTGVSTQYLIYMGLYGRYGPDCRIPLQCDQIWPLSCRDYHHLINPESGTYAFLSPCLEPWTANCDRDRQKISLEVLEATTSHGQYNCYGRCCAYPFPVIYRPKNHDEGHRSYLIWMGM